MYIVIDFDGTVVTHQYPKMGRDIGAVPILKKMVAAGNQLILFTMRSGKELKEAVNWFAGHNIELFGIQTNPTQHSWTTSPKAYGEPIIDDAALGCPLKYDDDRPYIDWHSVEQILLKDGII